MEKEKYMKFGIMGLGKMGGNLALQALEKGHEVVGSSNSVKDEISEAGAQVLDSPAEVAAALSAPRVVFLYLPAGEITGKVAEELGEALEPGDVIVEAGNSHWKDSKRRHEEFKERGIHFLDCGTSGGIDGARNGACFMVGGDEEAFEIVEPVFKDLAVEDGCLYVGSSGSGHFVKLMHNMIEFGMVQAIGEGVELLMRSEYELDMPALFHNWNHGSVIRSWLVELMEEGFRDYGDLSSLESQVEDTGEQVWGVQYAMDKEVPIPLLAQAVWGFYESRDADRPWAKAVAVMRHEYGDHPLKTK
jgi:6-phosphogluconate dehydrogenase